MKILDWKQGNLVGLEVPMSGKIWVRSLIIIYNMGIVTGKQIGRAHV